jgi:hypothetical protein
LITIFNFSSVYAQIEARKIDNLVAFAKLYGYVKYFYPGDKANSLDWNNLLITNLNEIENLNSLNDLEKKLQDIFFPIAPYIQIFQNNNIIKSKNIFNSENNSKPVFWQYLGFASIHDSIINKDVFKSVRVNLSTDSNNNDFNCFRILNAANYRGKELTFKLKIRTKFIDTNSFVSISASNYKKNFSFSSIYSEEAIRTDGFTESTIKMFVSDSADYLSIGITFNGKGEIELDDLKLLESKNGELSNIIIPNGDFEEFDSEGVPKDWQIIGNSYTLKQKTNEPIEGKSSFEISKLENAYSGELFNIYPKPNEFFEKELISNLKCRIPLTIYRDPHLDNNELSISYFDTTVYNKNFISQRNVQIANIIIVWNIIQHFYPYFEYTKLDWTTQLKTTLINLENIQNTSDYITELKLMLEPLKDGHISVLMPGNMPKRILPFKSTFVNNQVVCDKILDPIPIKLGDIITHIDNVPAINILNDREKFICGSPQLKRWMNLNYGYFGESNSEDSIQISVIRNNTSMNFKLARVLRNKLWKDDLINNSGIRFLSGNNVYIDLSSFNLDSFNIHLDQLKNANGLIVDLRKYPKNNIFPFISKLTKKTTSSPNMLIPEIIYPDRIDIKFKNVKWQIIPNENYLPCKKVFLIDNGTISYGETLASLFKLNKIGTFIGERTAGANGNVIKIKLLGNLMFNFSGMKITNEDDSQLFINGITPDINVQRTIKGIIEESDEVIEKAIEYLK